MQTITLTTLRINKAFYHVLFWVLAYLFWIYVFRNTALALTRTITIQFCYLLFIAANYYFNSLYAIPKLFNKKKYAMFLLAFLGMIIISAWLRVPESYFIQKNIFHASQDHFDILNVFFESFINIFFLVFFLVSAKIVADRVKSLVYIEQIEKERSENELNFLRAQFNPHFLFNSINSIYAHIDKSNKNARDMLLTFSDMLRYQLYECNVEKIDIQRELNYLKNYISLQRSRLDERIQVCFSANISNTSAKVPPLIFITFIENAFKYVGFNEHRPNIIRIGLNYNNGNLLFSVFNTKDNLLSNQEQSSGLGIANTRRRLELLYPGKQSLSINDSENDFEVSLIIYDI